MEKLYYPKRKVRALKNQDEIFAVLLPIIVELNKGKAIEPKSQEHHELKELLKRLDKKY